MHSRGLCGAKVITVTGELPVVVHNVCLQIPDWEGVEDSLQPEPSLPEETSGIALAKGVGRLVCKAPTLCPRASPPSDEGSWDPLQPCLSEPLRC